MKQIFQSLKNGVVSISELPVPHVGNNSVLVKTRFTLVSLGTEKMLLDFGKANFISKAKQQPDKVKQVFQKIKTDGLKPTIQTIQNKLDTPLALGYSNIGEVVEVGNNVKDFKVGDRVISNGPHAEYICLNSNLCSRVPTNVSDEDAVFTVVSSIGLQSVRLLSPTIGESIVVIGLGLIGLLTIQILKANGCQVIAYDFDQRKVDLAKSFGANAFLLSDSVDPVKNVLNATNERGSDGVIITASTKSHQVIADSANMCRKRGRVILAGVVGLNLSRSDFYEKEISFQVSCSYGPGRYENNYEKKGLDYPIGFVRWTEKRNFEAILQLISDQVLSPESLVDKIVDLNDVPKLYENLGTGGELGILIRYDGNAEKKNTVQINSGHHVSKDQINLAFIGAGNFSGHTLIPAFKKTGVHLKSIASSSGVTGFHQGKKWGFEETTSDYKSYWKSNIDTVVIATPHHQHCSQVIEALKAGKNVFVEKPLAITSDELNELKNYLENTENRPVLMTGYNRRFSQLTLKIKELLLNEQAPKCVSVRVNAGEIPLNHWTQDVEVGGGRLIGEGCHFVDLAQYIVNAEIVSAKAEFANTKARDNFIISLKFADGSIASIHYFSNGHKGIPKEQIEVYCAGKVLILDNFKVLNAYGFNNFKKLKLQNQDKGHLKEVQLFIDFLMGKSNELPISLEDQLKISQLCIDLFNK